MKHLAEYQSRLVQNSQDTEALLALGVAECKAGNSTQGLERLKNATFLCPNQWRYHFLYASMLEEAGDALGACQAYRRALALNPDFSPAQEALWFLQRTQVKAWHFSMMNDSPRNTAYENGIKSVVNGKIVLEIGAGSGLLSMMAARAGAKHVYACEMMPLIADKAREIIEKNGLSDRITLISKPSFAVNANDMPEKGEVLITETFDPNLIGEQILSIVADARERLLKPDAVMIPARATLMAALITSPELQEQTMVSTVCGFDLSPFNDFKVQPGIVVTAQNYGFTPLTLAISAISYDLRQDSLAQEDKKFALSISHSGMCHGMLSWIRLEMPDGSVYENSPLNPHTRPQLHWLHALTIWDHPFATQACENITISARYSKKQFVFELDSIL